MCQKLLIMDSSILGPAPSCFGCCFRSRTSEGVSKLIQLGTPIAMIPLFWLCAQLATDLLTAVAGNRQLTNAKEIVQLLYSQKIERVHDACECQGPGGRGFWKESRGGVCVLVVCCLKSTFCNEKMDLVNT